MKTVKFNMIYKETAKRWELLIRILWSIPSYIVIAVLGIISLIAAALQLLNILVFAKRNKTLYKWTLMYFKYYTKWVPYLMLLTDERNPILPED